jgi:hypothetical protein
MVAEDAHGLKQGLRSDDAEGPLEIGITYVNEKFHGQSLQ